jgi:hypothetical protein
MATMSDGKILKIAAGLLELAIMDYTHQSRKNLRLCHLRRNQKPDSSFGCELWPRARTMNDRRVGIARTGRGRLASCFCRKNTGIDFSSDERARRSNSNIRSHIVMAGLARP